MLHDSSIQHESSLGCCIDQVVLSNRVLTPADSPVEVYDKFRSTEMNVDGMLCTVRVN
jgi:hypothetical protein